MSTKKQISSLCKLYSINEEIPEEFVEETDVDSYFFSQHFGHFTVSQPISSS